MIGAYFPCFNELNSANEILYAYRKYFPNNSLVMVNDAGDRKHQFLGEKYQCKFFYETENVGYPGGQLHHAQITRWIKRFLKYIQLIDDDWFFLLEDDVFVMKTVAVDTLQYDICGINPVNILPDVSLKVIQSRGYCMNDVRIAYGAMGGAIFRTSFFKNMANRIDEVEKDINLFGHLCPQSLTGKNWYYSDVILSYLTYLYGGTIGQYPDFTELWFTDINTRLENNMIGALNQYKFLYKYPPHPLLTYFVPNKYTIVLQTQGNGPAFDLFVEKLLPRYEKFINVNDIEEFIVICPREYIINVKSKLSGVLPFRLYADDIICNIQNDPWIKEQIINLSICLHVKTEHYLILNDDVILTKELSFKDFFDNTGGIYYSLETNTNLNIKRKLVVTSQLMITRIVHQMLHAMGSDWINVLINYKTLEHSVYLIYLKRTFRQHYYVVSNNKFAVASEVNMLAQNLTDEQINIKLSKELAEKFCVV